MDDTFEWSIVVIFILLGIFVLVFTLVPLKIPLGNAGSHTGYVTAVEREGVFFKKYRVYFKTDTSSSQEDEYCIEDKNSPLAQALEKRAESKKLTVLRYEENFVSGLFNAYCRNEIVAFK